MKYIVFIFSKDSIAMKKQEAMAIALKEASNPPKGYKGFSKTAVRDIFLDGDKWIVTVWFSNPGVKEGLWVTYEIGRRGEPPIMTQLGGDY